MDYASLPWNSEAILLWLPRGTAPDAESRDQFTVGNDYSPPRPNPERFPSLGDALLSMKINYNQHGKDPWILIGGTIMMPPQVRRAEEFFKLGS
jgi:hypothetical protein